MRAGCTTGPIDATTAPMILRPGASILDDQGRVAPPGGECKLQLTAAGT